MKRLIQRLYTLSFPFAIACGAPPLDGSELGQLGEPLVSEVAPGTAPGRTRTGVSLGANGDADFNAIVGSGPGTDQTYIMPPWKHMTIRATQGPCTDYQWLRLAPWIPDVIREINDALGSYGWDIQLTADGKHEISCLDLPNYTGLEAGHGEDAIQNFARMRCTLDFANIIDDQGLTGNGYRYDVCTLHIDSGAILSYGTSSSNEARMYRRAVRHALIKLLGVGTRPGFESTYASSHKVDQTIEAALFSGAELCRTRYYRDAYRSNPTVLGLTTRHNCPNY